MDVASAWNSSRGVGVRWSLRLLGGCDLIACDSHERVHLPGKRERVLLAYLAIHPNCRQTRRTLATLLWGDATDETALSNLRTCVWTLRKALGDTNHRVITSEGEDITLDGVAFDTDAVAFRGLTLKAGRAELEEAVNLYGGEFLQGIGIDNEEFESWRREEAERFKEQALDALNRVMTILVESGESERAIEIGLKILRLEPLHEGVTRRLMLLYAHSGRRGAAIQLYRRLSDTLRDELNTEPELETRAVLAEVTRSDEARVPAATDCEAHPAFCSTTNAGAGEKIREPQQWPVQLVDLASGSLRRAKVNRLHWMAAHGIAAAIAVYFLYRFAVSLATTAGQ